MDPVAWSVAALIAICLIIIGHSVLPEYGRLVSYIIGSGMVLASCGVYVAMHYSIHHSLTTDWFTALGLFVSMFIVAGVADFLLYRRDWTEDDIRQRINAAVLEERERNAKLRAG